jgi:hypothetical protein
MSDSSDEKVVERAKESEGLEAIYFGCGVIGYDWEINGPGANLVDFKPTRAELMTLAWDYLKRHASMAKFCATGYSGSSEYREILFCSSRFESISEALSPGKAIPDFEEFIAQQTKEIDEIAKETELSLRKQDEANDQP